MKSSHDTTETLNIISGIDMSLPMTHAEHEYRKSFYLGNSRYSEETFFQLLVGLKAEWRGADYNVLSKNCHTFAQHLCDLLDVASVPAFVTMLPELVGHLTSGNSPCGRAGWGTPSGSSGSTGPEI